MDKPQLDTLRKHLADLLTARNAHVGFEQALDGLPSELRGARTPGFPHTPWQLLEHLRIAQWDILEYSRNPDHESPEWPAGYWPASDAPASAQEWDASFAGFRFDLAAMLELIRDPATDLFAGFPWAEDATLLGEALLLADHNAYHVGQIVAVRRALGSWPG